MKRNLFAAVVLLGTAAVTAHAADIVTSADATIKITRLNERDVMIQSVTGTATIDLRFAGAERIDFGTFGELSILKTNGGLAHYRPDVYQMINGKVRHVRVSYKLNGKDRATMNFSSFNKDAPLILRMGAATL